MKKGNRKFSILRNFDNGTSVVKIGKKEALYARIWPYLSPNLGFWQRHIRCQNSSFFVNGSLLRRRFSTRAI